VATTQWSQVLAARDGSSTEAHRALEELCVAYWQPLYAFLRRLGCDPEEARDLTQAYFAELLEKDFLADVDADKGRFRSFLFTSMRHFLFHERDRSKALKRGGGTTVLSLDVDAAEHAYSREPIEELTPEDVFERRWALTVIYRGASRLQQQAAAAGKEQQFEQLKGYLTDEGSDATYREAARALDMTEGAVKVAVHRLRKRFGQCLRAELAETVADSADIDAELKHLLTVTSR
jgi:RNA polymerase sigma-70 factor (ECF subfamily)